MVMGALGRLGFLVSSVRRDLRNYMHKTYTDDLCSAWWMSLKRFAEAPHATRMTQPPPPFLMLKAMDEINFVLSAQPCTQ